MILRNRLLHVWIMLYTNYSLSSQTLALNLTFYHEVAFWAKVFVQFLSEFRLCKRILLCILWSIVIATVVESGLTIKAEGRVSIIWRLIWLTFLERMLFLSLNLKLCRFFDGLIIELVHRAPIFSEYLLSNNSIRKTVHWVKISSWILLMFIFGKFILIPADLN